MATSTTAPDVSPRAGAGRPVFRGDVDGLRAVTIVLVVAYHSLVPDRPIGRGLRPKARRSAVGPRPPLVGGSTC
jgi:peptidoglycan/LPS O-acetylase OafA/YrhL